MVAVIIILYKKGLVVFLKCDAQRRGKCTMCLLVSIYLVQNAGNNEKQASYSENI